MAEVEICPPVSKSLPISLPESTALQTRVRPCFTTLRSHFRILEYYGFIGVHGHVWHAALKKGESQTGGYVTRGKPFVSAPTIGGILASYFLHKPALTIRGRLSELEIPPS